MADFQKVPKLGDEYLYIPFVGAIIERSFQGEKQILVQTRVKKVDVKYSGSLEIPGGKLRAFEDVYETLRREVKEECGLELISIEGEDKRESFINREDKSDLIEPLCVTQMKNGPFIGLIFLCRAEGEPLIKTDETKEAQWMNVSELKKIVEETPEQIYTAFLAPLKKYIRQV
ncbi:MAG TPA: NUDIX domain-containing protein [Patescibacteria group bacterium]|nr:NUDIX domain-containing protein [Patescibacteria group bacterium]